MKTGTFKFTYFLAILALGFTSCKKEDDSSQNAGKFKAKINGVAFSSEDDKAKAKFVTSTKMIQFIGQNENETINFELLGLGGSITNPEDYTPGSYDFNPANTTNLDYQASALYTKYENSTYTNWGNNWSINQTGKIIIESNTGQKIKGTFFFDLIKINSDGSFDQSNVKKITDGSFDLDVSVY